jgi:hypothetical protein
MIINHEYKFIFLKTRKTAGTSLEISLSTCSGDKDIVTSIVDSDETIRKEFGGVSAQNFNVPFKYYNNTDWLRLLFYVNKVNFSNHDTAKFVKERIDRKIWDEYFKFCFERNPFDKFISRYYWSTKEPRPSMKDFVNSIDIKFLSDWDVYTINDSVEVDFVGRYENLSKDMRFISEKIGLPNLPELPKAKGTFRKNREHYSNVIDSETKDRLSLVCAKEIQLLGYEF